VATLGDYLVVDLSGGTNAISYPINYYRTLADLPGGVGVNSDAFKTTNMVFRRIPAGSFIMGTPTNELGRQSNEPQHQVALTHPFYIGVFEVTQKQWERVMGTWPSYFTNESYRDSRPVESLSYGNLRGTNTGALWPSTNTVDMYSFMGRLRARTDKAFDLPTEAQWEYAGRAGTTPALNSGVNLTSTTDCTNIFEVGRYWFNGWGLSGQNADTTAGTSKVASYLPNAWGLYDMHGNALEWCLDWSGTYPDKTSDPVGALSGAERVQRGGSWNLMASECRIGYRRSSSPDASSYARGFRVALPSGQ
jgi:formylglycine-generating enzyme required for sulfatase activity